MHTIEALRLTTLDMIKNAALEHKDLMGVEIAAFQVPWHLFRELQKNPKWQQSGFSYMGYIENFTVIAKNDIAVFMYEKGDNTPFWVVGVDD